MKRYICSEVVKGATHRRNGLPCQDNKKIIEISDQDSNIGCRRRTWQ